MLQLIVYRNEQFCHHEKVMIDIGLPSFTSSEYGFPVIIANIFCNTGNSSPSYFWIMCRCINLFSQLLFSYVIISFSPLCTFAAVLFLYEP